MKEQAGKQYQQQYIIQIKLFLFHCCDLTWLPTVTHFETFFSHSCYCGVISNSQQHLLFFFPHNFGRQKSKSCKRVFHELFGGTRKWHAMGPLQGKYCWWMSLNKFLVDYLNVCRVSKKNEWNERQQ